MALLICNDVLIDVFNFYDRRQIAVLETVCRRYRQLIVRYFSDAPFLILKLECHLQQNSSCFSAMLSSPDIETGRTIRSWRKVAVIARFIISARQDGYGILEHVTGGGFIVLWLENHPWMKDVNFNF